MRALVLIALVGCGGAQVKVETARVAACQATEERFEEQAAKGKLTREEAIAKIDVTREVCDQLHARIAGEDGPE